MTTIKIPVPLALAAVAAATAAAVAAQVPEIRRYMKVKSMD
jgi:hypothetical protein